MHKEKQKSKTRRISKETLRGHIETHFESLCFGRIEAIKNIKALTITFNTTNGFNNISVINHKGNYVLGLNKVLHYNDKVSITDQFTTCL